MMMDIARQLPAFLAVASSLAAFFVILCMTFS